MPAESLLPLPFCLVGQPFCVRGEFCFVRKRKLLYRHRYLYKWVWFLFPGVKLLRLVGGFIALFHTLVSNLFHTPVSYPCFIPLFHIPISSPCLDLMSSYAYHRIVDASEPMEQARTRTRTRTNTLCLLVLFACLLACLCCSLVNKCFCSEMLYLSATAFDGNTARA